MKTLLPILLAFSLSAAYADPARPFVPTDAALAKKAAKVKLHGLRSPIGPGEEVEAFVNYPGHVVLTVPEMVLMSSQSVPMPPWSGHSWSLTQGRAARRFADPGFPNSDDWKANFDYANVFAPPSAMIQRGSVDSLSPAEKYDLLTDPTASYRFTAQNWEEGAGYYRQTGTVEKWMGVCNGTSAAGIMDRAPQRTVEAIAADGVTRIRFYPSDIRALSSAFWEPPLYWVGPIGWRCDQKEILRANGRALDPKCADTNAGAFHLALINQIGLFKRPFIMDLTPSSEVWNHAVYAYDFKWVNPKTGASSTSFRDALVAKGSWDDRFAAYRSPQTKFVIGVRTTVDYRLSRAANSREETTPSYPGRSKTYSYDLELDEFLRVVGGEWYTDDYPDFLWHPMPKQPHMAESERNLSTPWDVTSTPIPPEWQTAAQVASTQKCPWDQRRSCAIPLNTVVQSLIRASRGE